MGKHDGRRLQSAATVPVALSIAGSDSSAGAGIQADLKTFSALGVYGLTAVTCIVAEIPGKVSRIEAVSAKIVNEQIEVLAKSFPIAAIKTGLLCFGRNRFRCSENDTEPGQDVRATDSAGDRSGVCSNERRSSPRTRGDREL